LDLEGGAKAGLLLLPSLMLLWYFSKNEGEGEAEPPERGERDLMSTGDSSGVRLVGLLIGALVH